MPEPLSARSKRDPHAHLPKCERCRKPYGDAIPTPNADGLCGQCRHDICNVGAQRALADTAARHASGPKKGTALMYEHCDHGDHTYPGMRGDKPSATCSECGYVNRSYASYIGSITRLANQRGVSWDEAEREYNARAEAMA